MLLQSAGIFVERLLDPLVIVACEILVAPMNDIHVRIDEHLDAHVAQALGKAVILAEEFMVDGLSAEVRREPVLRIRRIGCRLLIPQILVVILELFEHAALDAKESSSKHLCLNNRSTIAKFSPMKL